MSILHISFNSKLIISTVRYIIEKQPKSNIRRPVGIELKLSKKVRVEFPGKSGPELLMELVETGLVYS